MVERRDGPPAPLSNKGACAINRFTHKVVLITGASTGIGRATALAFAKEGAAVMIGDVDRRSEQTVRDIEAAGGRADNVYVWQRVRFYRGTNSLTAPGSERFE